MPDIACCNLEVESLRVQVISFKEANGNLRRSLSDVQYKLAVEQGSHTLTRDELENTQLRVDWLEKFIIKLGVDLPCHVCDGRGWEDMGVCGDPECCGVDPSCDYCKGTGSIRGRHDDSD